MVLRVGAVVATGKEKVGVKRLLAAGDIKMRLKGD
jgi:hypothetical protein